MTPYEKTVTVTTTGANEIVAVDFPGRCVISRVAVVRVGTGAFTVDFYNRAFTSAAVAISRVEDDGNTKCRLLLAANAALAVGDLITVADTSVVGYNTTHRVTAKVDDRNYVTDQAYSADATGGTVTLAIPTTEEPLYKAMAQMTGTDSGEASPEAVFRNQDPLLNVNIGVKRKIYLRFLAAATYRVALRAYENVGN